MTTAAQNSKQILAQKGTAATPSFSFLGGNATGAYLAGTNQYGIATAGVQAVLVDASQNVTITNKLTIGSLVTPTVIGGAAASSSLTLQSTSGVGTSDSIIFKTGNAVTAMTIDTSQNVGIGTSSPGQKLDVVNTANSGVSVRVNSTNAGSSTSGSFILGNDVDSSVFYIQQNSSGNTTLGGANSVNLFSKSGAMTFSTTSNERMRIDSSGNVGIGIANGTSKLEVAGSNANNGGARATYEGTIKINESGISSLQATGGLEFKGSVFGSGYGAKIVGLDASDLVFGQRNNSATWSERMRIDSSGNVGIGTSSPSNALSVSRATGEAVISITNSGTASSWLTLSPGSGGVGYIHNVGNTSTVFTTNGSERMRIDSSGNVGIGTTSPSTKFTVSGSANIVGNLWTPDYGYIGNSAGSYSSPNTCFQTVSGSSGYLLILTNGSERARIDASGNVGIGTSSPAASLSVVKQTTALSGTGNSYGLYMYPTSSGLSYIDAITGSTGNTSLGFRTYNNGTYNEVRIDSSGNVGIGTSSPSAKLNVISSGTTGGQLIVANASYSTTLSAENGYSWITSNGAYPLLLATNGSERMRIDASGRLLVNTTSYFTNSSTAAFKSLSSGSYSIACLDPATSGSRYFADFLVGSGGGTEVGYIYYNGSVMVYAGTSDGRLKTNVVDANSAISDLNSIKIRSFDWIESGVHQKYGVVAQELQETAPEYVATPQKPEGMLGVDYGLMVPMLVKAIQELSAKNDALEARLAKLEIVQ